MPTVKKIVIFVLIFFMGTIKIASANYDVSIAIGKCLSIQKMHGDNYKLNLKNVHPPKATPSLHLNSVYVAFLDSSPKIFNPLRLKRFIFLKYTNLSYQDIFLQRSKKPPKL